MAIASGGSVGTANNTTANQSSLAITTGAQINVGDEVFILYSADSDQNSDGDQSEVTSVLPPGANPTATKQREYNNNGDSSGTQVVVSVWKFKCAEQINAGGTITINHKNVHDARCARVWKFTVDSGKTLQLVANATDVGSDAADLPSQEISDLSSLARLYLRASAKNLRGGVFTQTTNFTSFGVVTANTGGGTSSREICGEYRLNTSIGETSDPTTSDSPTSANVFLAFEEVSLGQNVAVAQVTETDTPQALTRVKTKAIGQPSETDLAQSLARLKTVTLGQNTETDTVQAVAWAPKHRLVGQVLETDLAQAVAWSPQHRLVAMVSEASLAQSLTAAKAKAVAQALESDAAQALTAHKLKAIGQCSETDLAQSITEAGATVVVVDQVLETDIAQAVAWSPKHRLVAFVTESDQAQPLAAAKVREILAAVETDLAQPIGKLKFKTLAQVIETDLAQGITPSVVVITINGRGITVVRPLTLSRTDVRSLTRSRTIVE